MSKRKHGKSSISNKDQSLKNVANDPECAARTTNITTTSFDSNEEDFLENTQMSMRQRRKILDKFHSRTRKLPGEYQHSEKPCACMKSLSAQSLRD